ncbi:hypothetical protein C3F09_10155 [candidate division GN15 bacterium]|uniref:Tyrosine--tRNA ligase SYY-like C-terminal domain-containing protein n=1 Tax=candidate division GN15 bacterium TaxID=2072418 RepID=A0A855WX10_9BACT|nr:MAG: hypothetical protein C3F09_10155 [candidate division GN15 bacterium]
MLLKKELGEILVDMYHPQGSGRAAREEFERVFSQKQLPDDIESLTVSDLRKRGVNSDRPLLVHILTATGLTKSNGEGRRLIEGGGVSIDDGKITDANFELDLGKIVSGTSVIVKAGKRRFLRISQ